MRFFVLPIFDGVIMDGHPITLSGGCRRTTIFAFLLLLNFDLPPSYQAFFCKTVYRGGYHYPLLTDFDCLPYPRWRGYVHNFLQKDCKGWGNDYLNPLSGECRLFSTVSWKLVGVVVTYYSMIWLSTDLVRFEENVKQVRKCQRFNNRTQKQNTKSEAIIPVLFLIRLFHIVELYFTNI